MRNTISVLSAFGLFAVSHLGAQDFTLDWHSVAGGGGESRGGDFDLISTIGEPHAGEMLGGDFTIMGVWGTVTSVETSLSVSLAEGFVIISWPESGSEDFELEETGALAAPWATVNATPQVSNGTKTVRLPLAPGNHFYRLHKP